MDDSTDSGRGAESDGVDADALEERLLEAVNRARQTRGVSALASDPDLRQLAAYHSARMARERDLFHVAPDGETLADRADRFGYDPAAKAAGQSFCHDCGADLRAFVRPQHCPECGAATVRDDGGAGRLGENLASRCATAGGRRTDEGRIATAIVDGWLDSPDHRENLLDDRFDRQAIGVAVVRSADDSQLTYVTQNLS